MPYYNGMRGTPLYEKLSLHYQRAIADGVLGPGDRLPSVRCLGAKHGVSLVTALQAYRHLERNGLVEARPRSGYFVARPTKRLQMLCHEPEGQTDPAQYVGIHERVSAILAAANNHTIRVDLAGACGAQDLYPCEMLQRATIRTLRRQANVLTATPDPRGCVQLRLALARMALDKGASVAANDIVVTNGCTEAIALALRAVTQPGDIVAVESPTYYGLLQILEALRLRAIEIPTNSLTGLSLEALELAGRSHTGIKAIVVVPALQNPTGSIMPSTHVQQLVDWCQAQEVVLIADETYLLLIDGVDHFSVKARDGSGNVIVCSSLTKCLAPGMRLGWIAAGRWQRRIEMLKYSLSRPNETLSQIVAAEFLTSGAFDRHLRCFKNKLRARRSMMADAISRLFPAGTRFTEPSGGTNLWVELPRNVASLHVFEAALLSGIKVAPGVLFSNSNRFDGYLRINCSAPFEAEIRNAVRTLGEIVGRLGNSSKYGSIGLRSTPHLFCEE